jgi:glycosyltransferase involved in cell wall biosynthesis
MTSDFEGTPMVLLEAMASGLSVVASAVDGVAEVCTDGEDALLIKPGDPRAFYEELASLIAHPERMDPLGENARKTILQRYDIRQLARRIEQIYDEVLSENG